MSAKGKPTRQTRRGCDGCARGEHILHLTARGLDGGGEATLVKGGRRAYLRISTDVSGIGWVQGRATLRKLAQAILREVKP